MTLLLRPRAATVIPPPTPPPTPTPDPTPVDPIPASTGITVRVTPHEAMNALGQPVTVEAEFMAPAGWTYQDPTAVRFEYMGPAGAGALTYPGGVVKEESGCYLVELDPPPGTTMFRWVSPEAQSQWMELRVVRTD